MEDLIDIATPDGGFEKVKDVEGGPVPDEEALQNIKDSVFINAPLFANKKKRPGTCIFVAGGPTINNYLDEIRERNKTEYVITSNNTHDYLISNDIIPDACLVLDPKEIVKGYIKHPHKDVQYYVTTVANKAVATQLLEAGCKVEKLLIAYGMPDDADIELQKSIYHTNKEQVAHFLVGGTMTGLRMMPFAIQLGFSKLEYYGFDSCFSNEIQLVGKDEPDFKLMKSRNFNRAYNDADTGEEYAIRMDEGGAGIFYAYYKVRAENITIAKTPDGRKFITSPTFAHQAKQFIKWYDRMEGDLEIVVHGDTLSSHLLKCHLKARENARAKIGDRRWTEEYVDLQKDMHQRYLMYGADFVARYKWLTIETVAKAVITLNTMLQRRISVLDYGCGKGGLGKHLESVLNIVDVTSYDPFVEEFSKEPEGKFDIVTCIDVMEHVEEQCVDNTLKILEERCKYMCVFVIAMSDAMKVLSDGRNAHITQRSSLWWISKLQEKFVVGEAIKTAEECDRKALFAVCQSIPGRIEYVEEINKFKEEAKGMLSEPKVEKVLVAA